MLKSVTNPTEMKEYTSNLVLLANLINESSGPNNGFIGLQHLIDYVSLLKFKTETNLIKELKVDGSSGMVSFGHIAQLMAEKNNFDLKIECSYTPEEIRSKLIKELDSTKIRKPKNFDISGRINLLANRYYLSLLEKANIEEDIIINSSLVESGDSDLIRIIMTGYCTPLGTICSCETDLYVQKSRLKKKKIKIEGNADVHLPEELTNQLRGWFGIQSNMVYEFIGKEKGLEPRKVKRTIFAPFYNKFFEPTREVRDIDPYHLRIYEDILMDIQHSCPYILSVHIDTSTKHFNPFYETENKSSGKKLKTEKPNIAIDHKYYCLDKEVAEQLKEHVSEKDILILKKEEAR